MRKCHHTNLAENKIYTTVEMVDSLVYMYTYLAFKSLLIKLFFHVKTDASFWMRVACWLLCLSTAGTFAVLRENQVAQQTIKTYRSKGRGWVTGSCKHLVGLLHQKNAVVKKLAAAADAVGRDMALSEAERHFQVSARRNKVNENNRG